MSMKYAFLLSILALQQTDQASFVVKTKSNDALDRILHLELQSNPLPTTAPTVTPYDPLQTYCIDNSTLVYGLDNLVIIQESLINCLSTFDALIYPGLEYGKEVIVNTTFYVNNLVAITEIDSSVEFDFSYPHIGSTFVFKCPLYGMLCTIKIDNILNREVHFLKLF